MKDFSYGEPHSAQSKINYTLELRFLSVRGANLLSQRIQHLIRVHKNCTVYVQHSR